MGSESYMMRFTEEHELAFGSVEDIPIKNRTPQSKGSAHHGLHTDGGLPETANGLGWYSMNRLGYREWYRLSCSRMAYDELVERNPTVVFQLLLSSTAFPWLAVGAGTTYLISSIKRIHCLYKENGVQVAKNSVWSKVKCVSTKGLQILTAATLFKMMTDNYNIDWRDMVEKYVPYIKK